MATIHITGDVHADQVLTDDPSARLVRMMLDQHIRSPSVADIPSGTSAACGRLVR